MKMGIQDSTVSSKFSLQLIFGAVLILALIAVLIVFSVKKGPEVAAIFPIALFAIAAFFLFRRISMIRFSENSIKVWQRFRWREYAWEQVWKFQVSRYDGSSLFSSSGEGMELRFDNGDRVFLLASLYANMRALRAFAYRKLGHLDPLDRNHMSLPIRRKRYTGHIWLNTNSFLIFFPTGVFFFLAAHAGRIEFYLLALGLTLVFLWGTGFQMYYFEIDQGKLRVRNHFHRWYRRDFDLDGILLAGIEKLYRSSDALLFFTSDFQSHSFWAGSLWQEDWHNLISDLQASGVAIRP